MVVCRAPGKVILFGEHFVVYGIRALLCATNLGVTVRIEDSSQDVISVRSALGSTDIPLGTTAAAVSPMIRSIYYAAMSIRRGSIVDVQSDIPSGAGLGSSSACCVAAAGAALSMTNDFGQGALLSLSIAAERSVYPESSGADCTASVLGGVVEYTTDTTPMQLCAPADLRLVVSYSGTPHSTRDMVYKVGRLAASRPGHFEDLLGEADQISSKAADALAKNNIKEVGYLATQNQTLLEQIGISNDNLQNMIRIADRHSYGSKITGAGGGGSIVAVTDGTNTDDTLAALREAGYPTYDISIGDGAINS